MVDNTYGGLLRTPGADFGAVRDGRNSPLQYVAIDLSGARSLAAGTALAINVPGNFFFSDMNPNLQGGITVHFQDISQIVNPAAGIYCPPGFVAKIPFTQFLVENDAQPGKRALIAYGTDVDIDPGGAAQVSIAGVVNVAYGQATPQQMVDASDRSFIAQFMQVTGAGQNGYIMLYNPDNSPTTAAISKVRVSLHGADGFVKLGPAIPLGAAGPRGINKVNYQFDTGALPWPTRSTSRIYSSVNAGNLFPNVGQDLYDEQWVKADTPQVWTFDPPIVLTSGDDVGNGLTIGCTQSTTMAVSYEFTESK